MGLAKTAAALAALLIAGCASIPGDRGRDGANHLAAVRGLPVAAGEAADGAADLLSRPLGPHEAVRVALLANPDLGAEYAELGLAAADVYEAGRLSNPRLGASRLDSDAAGALDQVTFGLSQGLASLLTLGDRSGLAGASLERAQAQAAASIFELALDTARAWYGLAAEVERARVASRIADAADAAAELGERFHQAGNLSRLELAGLRAEAARARMQAIEGRVDVDDARARLGRLMGVEAGAGWRIREGLPAPGGELPDGATLKRLAADNRLDLLAARHDVAVHERALDITRRWRWLGDPELELETERESDGSRLTGAGLSIEIPVFNQHADEKLRAESLLAAADARREAVANRASHELALARARLAASRERLAAFGDGLLPEHRRRVAETQKRVNYMLAGVFELLETRIAEYRVTGEYLEAVRDHWLARLDLDAATGILSAPPSGADRVSAESLLASPAADDVMPGMEHGEKPGGEAGNDHDQHGH